MASRGGLEAPTRAHLELLHRRTNGPFDAAEASAVLQLTPRRTRQLLAYLASRGWLTRVRYGLYTTVPLGAVEPSDWRVDPWLVAAKTFALSYIGGWTALEHWELTEQLFRDVVVFTAKRARGRQLVIQDVRYVVKRIKSRNLFGTRQVWREQTSVDVSDPERTLIDILDEPSLGGGIRHIADCILAYFEDEPKPSLLISYGDRLGNRTVFKRLGFVLESMEIAGQGIASDCHRRISKGLSKLDPTVASSGRIVKRWNLRVNVEIGRGPMISRFDLDERVREWQLRDNVVEKDYVIGWVLWGIGANNALSDGWAFKGGTCLKKCYIETFRFSEDLDFTVLPGGPFEHDDVVDALNETLRRVQDESGIDFTQRQIRYRVRPDRSSAEGRIYYLGPREAPTVASIKLDLTRNEEIVRPTVLRPIGHSYPDQLPGRASVRCYSFEEVFAEKLRALGERGRPRDLYDVVLLYRRPDLRGHPSLISDTLAAKCQSKGVPIPSLEEVASDAAHVELTSEWENMLAHQLPQLPPFDHIWGELPNVFAWLAGLVPMENLPPIPTGANEDREWSPPPLVATDLAPLSRTRS